MLGLSVLGIIHTAISLVALAAGFVALGRFKEISPRTSSGKWYIITTILTCLTGFMIFRHGTFGKAHALGVITLVVLAVAWAGGSGKLGGLSRYVETLAYSLTFFFHFIPAFTESFTRLPVSAPLAANDQDPKLQAVIGVCFLLFVIGAILQIVRLKKAKTKAGTSAPAVA